MRALIIVAGMFLLVGCASTPKEAATDRFESCMDSTLASFGPFRFGTQEARLKAAEICKDVMQAK
jgi:uncharacterized protein YcfL